MKVLPVASKADIATPQDSAPSAKARAVAAFKSASPTETPQAPQHSSHPTSLDQNSLHAEDLGSVRIPAPNVPDKGTLTGDASEVSDDPSIAPKQEPDPALSRQFAQLARQEKALRAKALQQDQAYKAREAALLAREDALKQQAQAPSVDLTRYIPKDRLKDDPLGALADAGTSYDEVTQRMINRVPVDPMVQQTIDSLKAEVAELRKFNEDGKKSQTEQQQSQYQAAVKQITTDAKALIKSDPIAYEAIVKTGTVRDVVKLIEETYARDGVLLSVEDAAKEVEDYLVEENYKMATKIDKIRKRIGQVAPAQASTQQRPANPAQPQMKTLTNAVASSRPLSARERALLAFKGEKF